MAGSVGGKVAPVQQQKEIQNQPPKKKSKVIKSKEVIKKPEKTEAEADTKLEDVYGCLGKNVEEKTFNCYT